MSSRFIIRPLPYIALLIAHLIWGVNFVVAKVTLQDFPPSSLAFFRFALALILLLPFFYLQKQKIKKIDKKDLPKLIGIGVLLISLNISFFFAGIAKSSITNASILTLSVPIFSVLVGWIFLKEKIYLINLTGTLTCLMGALIVLRVPQMFIGSYSTDELLGNIFILLASVSWVGGSILSKEMLKKYPSLVVTSIAFLVGIITFFIPTIREYIQNPAWLENLSMLSMFGLVYMAVLSSVSAYFLFEWGLNKTSVTQANLLQYIEPFIAAVLGITLLGEKLTIPFIAGLILILAGVYLGTLAKTHHLRTRF